MLNLFFKRRANLFDMIVVAIAAAAGFSWQMVAFLIAGVFASCFGELALERKTDIEQE
jgi:hypothetical protein